MQKGKAGRTLMIYTFLRAYKTAFIGKGVYNVHNVLQKFKMFSKRPPKKARDNC